MMVLSFNNTKSRTLWGGFTTKWYTQMFENQAIMNALYNTLLIASLSALIATIIGTVAAIGINSMKSPSHHCHGREQHSDVKLRDCNRYLPDAGIHCLRHLPWDSKPF